jgi:hypothetical protein
LKHTWYPIDLPVWFESRPRCGLKGCGKALAINSSTVRFASDQDLHLGLRVWLTIPWPAQLPDGTRLSLSIFGRIERSAFGEVEVAVSRHEFRTRVDEGYDAVGNITG